MSNRSPWEGELTFEPDPPFIIDFGGLLFIFDGEWFGDLVENLGDNVPEITEAVDRFEEKGDAQEFLGEVLDYNQDLGIKQRFLC